MNIRNIVPGVIQPTAMDLLRCLVQQGKPGPKPFSEVLSQPVHRSICSPLARFPPLSLIRDRPLESGPPFLIDLLICLPTRQTNPTTTLAAGGYFEFPLIRLCHLLLSIRDRLSGGGMTTRLERAGFFLSLIRMKYLSLEAYTLTADRLLPLIR